MKVSFGSLAVLGFASTIVLIIVVGMRRMGWLGKSDRKVSSGAAAWLGEINEMLQPQLPTAEQLAKLSEEGEQEEDEGEGDPPEAGLAPITADTTTPRP